MSEGLSVIDMTPLWDGDPGARAATARALDAACRTFGFFYLTGHRLDAPLARLEVESRRFFDRPLAEKMRLPMSAGGPAWRGYFPVGDELTSGRPDLKEGLYLGEELGPDDPRVTAGWPLHGANQWPSDQPGLKPAVLDYMAAATRAGQALLEGVAEALGLASAYFERLYTARPTVLFRIFRYPARPPSDGRDWPFGVGEHTDYGLLTLLAQDANGGLEIKGRDGVWFAAPPVEGALVVNIGDMLDRLTRGAYRSAPHRVTNASGNDRLSWPLFLDPAFDAVIEPLPIPDVGPRESRWDAADLDAFSGPYGDYLLGKVGKVFPDLKATVIPGETAQKAGS